MAKAVTTIAGSGELVEIRGNPEEGSVSISSVGLTAGARNGSQAKPEAAQAVASKNERNRQSDEKLSPHSYYVKSALPVLRGFVDNIGDERLRRHYNQVLEQLDQALKKAETVDDRYVECFVDIEKIGGRNLATSVEELYLWQLRRSIELVSVYKHNKRIR